MSAGVPRVIELGSDGGAAQKRAVRVDEERNHMDLCRRSVLSSCKLLERSCIHGVEWVCSIHRLRPDLPHLRALEPGDWVGFGENEEHVTLSICASAGRVSSLSHARVKTSSYSSRG